MSLWEPTPGGRRLPWASLGDGRRAKSFSIQKLKWKLLLRGDLRFHSYKSSTSIYTLTSKCIVHDHPQAEWFITLLPHYPRYQTGAFSYVLSIQFSESPIFYKSHDRSPQICNLEIRNRWEVLSMPPLHSSFNTHARFSTIQDNYNTHLLTVFKTPTIHPTTFPSPPTMAISHYLITTGSITHND